MAFAYLIRMCREMAMDPQTRTMQEQGGSDGSPNKNHKGWREIVTDLRTRTTKDTRTLSLCGLNQSSILWKKLKVEQRDPLRLSSLTYPRAPLRHIVVQFQVS